MKISAIRLLAPSHPNFVLVEVEMSTGVIGIGLAEAHAPAVRAIIADPKRGLAISLIGQEIREPDDVASAWRTMFENSGAQGGPMVNAIGAIDMALWDALGKARGVPIHELLGGAAQPRVMAYASATAFLARPDGAWDRKSPDHLVTEIRRYAQQGYKAIKFGWGNHFASEDQQILAAMRRAIDPDIRFMLDFGNPAYWTPGWNAQRALAVARMCEEHDIYFLEEPLPPHDVDGFVELTKESGVKTATGEMLCAPHEFAPFIERRAADILQPDAARIGITPFAEVARIAERAGIATVPHSPWSALAIAAHVNVLATLQTCEMVESPADGLYTDEGRFWGETTRIMTDEIVENPLKVADGFIDLPRSPGLGVGGFVPAAVERLELLAQEHRQ